MEFHFSMGVNRFKAIHASVGFSIEKLKSFSSILRKSFQFYWMPGSVVCFDESIYGYQPRKKTKATAEQKVFFHILSAYFIHQGNPVPTVYIPRKPHPNGLLNWVCASISTTTGTVCMVF